MVDCAEKMQALWPDTQHDKWMAPEGQSGLVSVIVPTYNRAQLLVEAMNSVWAQTYRPIEMLVVDDGSADATTRIVRKWTEAHSDDEQFTTRYLEQENSGAPAARNHGLIASEGAYIYYLDSDDLLHPQLIQTLIRSLKSYPECLLVFNDQEVFAGADKPIVASDVQKYVEQLDFGSLQRHQFVKGQRSHARALFSRSLCYQVGPWNEGLVRWQDMEYMCRVSCLQPQYLHVSYPMYFYRDHGKGRIEDLSDKRKGVEGGLHALGEIEGTLSAVSAQNKEVHHELGRLYLSTAKLAMEMDMPAKVKAALQGAKRQQPSLRFLVQLLLFNLLYFLIGSKAASALEQYSRIMQSLGELFNKLRGRCDENVQSAQMA